MARQEAAVAVHLLYLTQEVPAVGDYAKGELINCRKRKRNNLTKYPFSPQGGACITAHPYSQPMSSISAWKRGGEEERKKERKKAALSAPDNGLFFSSCRQEDRRLLAFYSPRLPLFPFPILRGTSSYSYSNDCLSVPTALCGASSRSQGGTIDEQGERREWRAAEKKEDDDNGGKRSMRGQEKN
jgi:hypothetical protein